MDKIHQSICLAECNVPPVGFLYVYNYCQISIVFHGTCGMDPKLPYYNYLQDTYVKHEYNMSYTEYMEGLIDCSIKQQDGNYPDERTITLL